MIINTKRFLTHLKQNSTEDSTEDSFNIVLNYILASLMDEYIQTSMIGHFEKELQEIAELTGISYKDLEQRAINEYKKL